MESATKHKILFNTKFIKTKSTGEPKFRLISKWKSEVFFELAAEDSLNYNDWFFLPPSKNKKIMILINLQYNNDKISAKNLQTIQDYFRKKKRFWESLLYKVEFFVNIEGQLRIELICQLWTQTKINTILDYQFNERDLSSNDTKLNHLKQVNIVGEFYSDETIETSLNNLIHHLREYLASLMVSQLEFKFPLIFSSVARKRMKEQENSFTVVSYAVKGNSTLFLKFLRITNSDRTASSIFQILSNNNYGQRLDML